jgi:hypothetical protein
MTGTSGIDAPISDLVKIGAFLSLADDDTAVCPTRYRRDPMAWNLSKVDCFAKIPEPDGLPGDLVRLSDAGLAGHDTRDSSLTGTAERQAYYVFPWNVRTLQPCHRAHAGTGVADEHSRAMQQLGLTVETDAHRDSTSPISRRIIR